MPALVGKSRKMLQPQLSQIYTRANQVPNHVLTHKELLKMCKDSLTMAAQAQEYLEKQGYVPPDAKGGKDMLSYILLLLLHATPPNVLPNGIRGVTTLLEHEEVIQIANMIVVTVMQKLDPVLELMDHAAEMVQEADSNTRKVEDQLYRMGEEMRDELQKGMGLPVVESIGWEVGEMWAMRSTGSESPSHQCSTMGSLAAHQSTLERVWAHEQLVLIDRDPSVSANNLDGLNERELVTKASEALGKMREGHDLGPEGARMVGAIELKKGGVIYELNGTVVAEWLRREKDAFAEGFGGTSIMKGKWWPLLLSMCQLCSTQMPWWMSGFVLVKVISSDLKLYCPT